MASVCGISKSCCSHFFLLLYSASIISLFVQLNSDNYFVQCWPNFDDLKFTGGLTKPRTIITYNGKEVCSNSDTYLECYKNCPSNCEFFQVWYSAGNIFFYFESVAILLTLFCVFVLFIERYDIVWCKSLFNIQAPGVIMIEATLAHVNGLVVWMWAMAADYKEKNNYWPYHSSFQVQAQSGANLALFNCGWLGFVTVVTFFLGKNLRNQEFEWF